MNKKDIALTVGGILASLVLAYLLWMESQKQQASNSAAQQNALIDAEEQAESEADYSSQLPTVSVSSLTASNTPTTNVGSTDTTSGDETQIDPAGDQLLASIIGAFDSSVTSQPNPTMSNASIIPTIGLLQGTPGASSLSGVAVDSGTALNSAANAVIGFGPVNVANTLTQPTAISASVQPSNNSTSNPGVLGTED